MNVKIDTKEKFTVITPKESEISANMAEEFEKMFDSYLEEAVPHLVINLNNVTNAADELYEMLIRMYEKFLERGISFVICELKPALVKGFEERDLLELLNITPSESEAWDIVQMEEIERELMRDERED